MTYTKTLWGFELPSGYTNLWSRLFNMKAWMWEITVCSTSYPHLRLISALTISVMCTQLPIKTTQLQVRRVLSTKYYVTFTCSINLCLIVVKKTNKDCNYRIRKTWMFNFPNTPYELSLWAFFIYIFFCTCTVFKKKKRSQTFHIPWTMQTYM